MCTLKGFDEFLDKINETYASIDVEGRKCFEKCGENLRDELEAYATKAGLPERLVEQIEEEYRQRGNHWSYECGWKKAKPKTPLPDTYKVLFYNYGTPKRYTASGDFRGEITPHPKGSHGFIKKAKLAAANRNKKLQRETYEKIIGGLKQE
jgi:hypothetical protein